MSAAMRSSRASSPQLLQASDLALRELLARQVGERRAPPERECRAEELRTFGGGRTTRLPEERLEADGVDGGGVCGEDVAGSARLDDIVPECAPQLGDGVLERGRRSFGALLAPEQVDETVGRDDLPVVHEQRREERALPLASEVDRAAVEESLERAEDPELTHAPSPCPCPGCGDNSRNADPRFGDP